MREPAARRRRPRSRARRSGRSDRAPRVIAASTRASSRTSSPSRNARFGRRGDDAVPAVVDRLLHVEPRDHRALVGEAPRARGADPRCRSRDHGHPSRQSRHVRSPPRVRARGRNVRCPERSRGVLCERSTTAGRSGARAGSRRELEDALAQPRSADRARARRAARRGARVPHHAPVGVDRIALERPQRQPDRRRERGALRARLLQRARAARRRLPARGGEPGARPRSEQGWREPVLLAPRSPTARACWSSATVRARALRTTSSSPPAATGSPIRSRSDAASRRRSAQAFHVAAQTRPGTAHALLVDAHGHESPTVLPLSRAAHALPARGRRARHRRAAPRGEAALSQRRPAQRHADELGRAPRARTRGGARALPASARPADA